MNRLFMLGSCTLLLLMTAAPADAQSAVPDLNRCTTANLFGGVASASSDRTPLFGGAIGWELAPRLTIETTTKWLVPDRGAAAFSVAFTAQVPLTHRQTFVPFVTGGMGVYSASFDPTRSEIPEFYGRRMQEPGAITATTGRFTDPAFVFGGGVSVFASRHVSLRPEVEAILVRRESRNYLVTTASVRLAYHFEIHRVTPALAPR